MKLTMWEGEICCKIVKRIPKQPLQLLSSRYDQLSKLTQRRLQIFLWKIIWIRLYAQIRIYPKLCMYVSPTKTYLTLIGWIHAGILALIRPVLTKVKSIHQSSYNQHCGTFITNGQDIYVESKCQHYFYSTVLCSEKLWISSGALLILGRVWAR